jgi:hypothetical protein
MLCFIEKASKVKIVPVNFSHALFYLLFMHDDWAMQAPHCPFGVTWLGTSR